ncbi:Metallopeptidase domain-containing protein [Tumidithrix helvetica PCC 7403]|uniref:vWA domain-containing protein n=1 Tax=Tumidithrix helvetica TaxID=3457545 RepID=UPI003CA40692
MSDLPNLISASLLRSRMKSPFFATLALFTRFLSSQQTPTAATDGKDIFFNPDYLRSLTSAQQDGLLVHEVLHAALLHVIRRGVRDPKLWNIAADIVVNGIIAQHGQFELPANGVRDRKLENLSVEEIYEILLEQCLGGKSSQQSQSQSQSSQKFNLPNPDLLDKPPEDICQERQRSDSGQSDSKSKQSNSGKSDSGQGKGNGSANAISPTPTKNTEAMGQSNLDSLSQSHKASLENHWQNAWQQAAIVARTTNQGKLPADLERLLGQITQPKIDWRTYLWRYLVQTPTDFSGFDRRFIGRGLYLESLIGESIKVFIAVDTSGSIRDRLLQIFLSEVKGILSSYPHLEGELYYADAEVYGPHEVSGDSELPVPKGGGGTSFIPFFNKVRDRWDGQQQAVCIYLTDGYGTFPTTTLELPVLWVVIAGGLALEKFPFGETVRLETS